MKILNDFDFKGKAVLVRSDLNCDVRVSQVAGRRSQVAKVIESERVRASAETIKELKRKGARVVVVAHQGRKGKGDFVSLKQHCRLLNKYVKVRFVEDVCGALALSEIGKLKGGEVILLENVRFVADEDKPEKGKRNELYKLVGVCDYFVSDAFSVCHRAQASVVLFPRYLKSFTGRLLEREVDALKKIKLKNCLYVLGGAKPADNMKLLSAEVRSQKSEVRNKILACGLFGQMCLIASGKNLGAQNKYLKSVVDGYDGILKELKGRLKNVEMPIDFAVKVGGRRVELAVEDFPSEYEIFDIGKKTREKYVGEIKKAKAVFMKGPAGDSADDKFAKGTVALLRAVSKVDFSLIGGGHLNDTIKKYRLKGFGHVSLSGGALLSYIAGEKLPGILALK
ncbi:MAG: phosphoglycerate kinase [archaeon]